MPDKVLIDAVLSYHRRFILEKPACVQMLVEGRSFGELDNSGIELIIEEEPDMDTRSMTE